MGAKTEYIQIYPQYVHLYYKTYKMQGNMPFTCLSLKQRSYQGYFISLQGTFDNVWKHFRLSQPGQGVEEGAGLLLASSRCKSGIRPNMYNAQDNSIAPNDKELQQCQG